MKRGIRRVVLWVLVVSLACGVQTALAKSNSKSSFTSGGKSSSSSSSGKSSGWSNSTSSPSTSSRTSSAPSPGWSNSGSGKPASSSSSGWGSGSSRPSAAPVPATPPSSPSSSGTAPSGWSGGGQPASPPTARTASPQAAPASGGGWSNASGTSAAPGTDSGRSKSSFAASGQSAIQKEESLKAYKDYQGRFAKPAAPAADPPAGAAPRPSRTWDSYRDYRDYRDGYYSRQGWSPPGYAYQSAPSFGLWDAMFLWFILRQASGPSFMYNHQNDPGVQAFRQEAEKMAASNEDLKKQLAELDAKVDQMRKDGVAVDAKRLPEGVDPAVAMSAEHVVKEAPARKSGGSWLWIVGASVGVAVVFLLLTRNRKTA